MKDIEMQISKNILLKKEHVKFKNEDFVRYSATFKGRKITRSSIVDGETVLKIINELIKEIKSLPS